MALWQAISACVTRGCAKDPPEDARGKRIMGPVAIFVVAISAFSIPRYTVLEDYTLTFAYGLFLAVSMFYLVSTTWGVVSFGMGLDVWMFGSLVGTLLLDLNSVADAKERPWPLLVLVLDVALVFDRPHLPRCAIPTMLVYLAVERSEAMFRWGLYDSARWGLQEGVVDVCDCDTPPCKLQIGSALMSILMFAMVLLIDFYLTRRFASALRQQIKVISATVRVAEKIAAALALYKVDDAGEAIKTEGDLLPSELQDSFGRLLSNLQAYRDYLPDSLLYPGDAEVAGGGVAPPGKGTAGDVSVALVFTDIQSSAALWEAHPRGMQDALRTHNTVLRSVAAECQNYEVKVIGDSMMLAAQTAAQAVEFGLKAQVRLAQSTWPSELFKNQLCTWVKGSVKGVPLWNGLRVRIGTHYGPTRVERNPVTGRQDYLGLAVITAARVEGAVKHGGLTGVSGAVLHELGGTPQDAAQFSMGQVDLRGVGPVTVHILLPRELADRWEDLNSVSTGLIGLISPEEDDLDADFGQATERTQRFEDPEMIAMRGGRGSPMRSKSPTSRPQRCIQLALKLTRSVGSFATVRAVLKMEESEVAAALSELLAIVDMAAGRTQGVLVNVVSSLGMVGWNTTSRCKDHVAQCALFIGLALRGTAANHVGAVTGPLLSGNVSSGRRKFATVVGEGVEMSAALAEEAHLRGKAALVAGQVAMYCANDERANRVQEWREVGGDVVPIWSVARKATESSQPPTANRQNVFASTSVAMSVMLSDMSSPHESEAQAPEEEELPPRNFIYFLLPPQDAVLASIS
eukprot:Hpha_TRINITY_DN8431_c0_g1::TRINITY_DN8431_c0_g1_i1::g.34532::m.34532